MLTVSPTRPAVQLADSTPCRGKPGKQVSPPRSRRLRGIAIALVAMFSVCGSVGFPGVDVFLGALRFFVRRHFASRSTTHPGCPSLSRCPKWFGCPPVLLPPLSWCRMAPVDHSDSAQDPLGKDLRRPILASLVTTMNWIPGGEGGGVASTLADYLRAGEAVTRYSTSGPMSVQGPFYNRFSACFSVGVLLFRRRLGTGCELSGAAQRAGRCVVR